MKSMTANLTILYTVDETGMVTAHIPEVPGAVSFGRTYDEAREMVLDALNELLAFRASESASEPAARRERLSFELATAP